MIDGKMNQEFVKNLQDQVNREQVNEKLEALNNELESLQESCKLKEEDEKLILEFGGVMDLDNLKPNSVLVVKIGVNNPSYAHNVQMGIIKSVLNPRMELLKEKKLTVLFMSDKDDITLLSEEDMNRAGWIKKDRSLIISPYEK